MGCRELGIKLSRTAYRHPDGNAFIERLYRTYKEECVWPNEFNSYDEALAAATAWVIDYNEHRSHDSLGRDTVPAEYRSPSTPRTQIRGLTVKQSRGHYANTTWPRDVIDF